MRDADRQVCLRHGFDNTSPQPAHSSSQVPTAALEVPATAPAPLLRSTATSLTARVTITTVLAKITLAIDDVPPLKLKQAATRVLIDTYLVMTLQFQEPFQ